MLIHILRKKGLVTRKSGSFCGYPQNVSVLGENSLLPFCQKENCKVIITLILLATGKRFKSIT